MFLSDNLGNVTKDNKARLLTSFSKSFEKNSKTYRQLQLTVKFFAKFSLIQS